MKIMRPESWPRDWSETPARETMHCGIRAVSPRRPTGPRVPQTGDSFMQWTTPTACDLRFGFEITMYVSAR